MWKGSGEEWAVDATTETARQFEQRNRIEGRKITFWFFFSPISVLNGARILDAYSSRPSSSHKILWLSCPTLIRTRVICGCHQSWANMNHVLPLVSIFWEPSASDLFLWFFFFFFARKWQWCGAVKSLKYLLVLKFVIWSAIWRIKLYMSFLRVIAESRYPCYAV